MEKHEIDPALAEQMKFFDVAPGVTVFVAWYEEKDKSFPYVVDISFNKLSGIEYVDKRSFKEAESRDVYFTMFDEFDAEHIYETAYRLTHK